VKCFDHQRREDQLEDIKGCSKKGMSHEQTNKQTNNILPFCKPPRLKTLVNFSVCTRIAIFKESGELSIFLPFRFGSLFQALSLWRAEKKRRAK